MPRAAATNRFRIRDFVSSLLFDGASSTVVVPHNANQLLTSGFTISAWINPRTRGETAGRIVDKSEATNGTNGFIFAIDSIAANRMLCQINAGSSVSSAGNSIKLGVWQHVLITVSAAALVTHYINGAASGSPATTGALSGIITTNALTIGNRSGATDRTFDGWIDEVRIWNRVLTAQEISDLYYLGVVSASGLIGEYLFNEGAGTVATDTSLSANNGTITAATYSADVPMKPRKQVNGNMVKNGDFEYAPPFTAATTTAGRWIDGTSGGAASNNLFGWAIPTAGITAGASARFDPTLSRSGSGSILLSTTDATGVISVTNAISGSSPSILTDAIYPLSPNTTYILTAYVQTVNAATNSVYCDFREFSYNGSTTGTTATTSTNKVSGTNSTWTLLTVTVTTASNTRFGQVLLRNLVAGNISSANFDDISLLPVYPKGRVPANGNLVKNFNFEVAPTFVAATTTAGRWIDGTLAGSTTNATYKWGTNSTNSVGSIAARFDPSTSATGVGSIKVSTTATGSDAVISNMLQSSATQVASFGIPVLPSTSYTYVFWMSTNYVSGDSNNGATVIIKERNAAASTLVTTTTTTVKVTSGWTRYTGTFTTGPSSVFCEIQPSVIGNSGAATLIMDAWFDDIYLAKTTNPGRVLIT